MNAGSGRARARRWGLTLFLLGVGLGACGGGDAVGGALDAGALDEQRSSGADTLEPGPPCVSSVDCPLITCRISACVSGGCVYQHMPDDSACEDGRACSVGDRCVGGACVPLDEAACAAACQEDADCPPFDPDDLCAGRQRCEDGRCVLDVDSVMRCELATAPCRQSACDPSSGACVEHALDDGSACDDGNPCTAVDTCDGGACVGAESSCQCEEDADCLAFDEPCQDRHVCNRDLFPYHCELDPGSAVDCSGLEVGPCQVGVCEAASGDCVAGLAPDGVDCDAGDPCLVGACEAGVCVVVDDLCPCHEDLDCPDDGDPCNGVLRCDTSASPHACVIDAASVVVCPSEGDGDCRWQACQPDSGACGWETATDGAPCAMDPCHVDGACQAGACVGTPIPCDDGDPCTSDGCDPQTGACVHAHVEAACDDGQACTEEDRCSDGVCAGAPVDCDDLNSCTFDACDPETGACEHVPVSSTCDDGDPCTLGDACVVGVCVVEPVDCDDGEVCTHDTCDPETGACVHAPADGPCDDGDPCAGEGQCQAGLCVTAPLSCDDANPCTADHCDPLTGACVHDPQEAVCDDGSLCTTDDACAAGACVGVPVSCDDAEVCTYDACDPATGACSHEPAAGPCDDGDLCTDGDTCDAGTCVSTPVSCDDGSPCTSDRCDPVTGACAHDPAEAGCDDGDLCTEGDACVEGTCVATPVDCDDGEVCTADACDPATGACSHEPAEGPCDDGDLCTEADVCAAGACAGSLVDCDDQEGCTYDWCDPETGVCEHKPLDDPCDDGDLCTEKDRCQEETGTCAGAAVDCDDDEVCTLDACDALTGACTHEPADGACDDGLVCTDDDTCAGGACVATPADCDDADRCTDDACVEGLGLEARCQHTATEAGAPCSDGDMCTQVDQCDGLGACAGADPVICPDDGACGHGVCAPDTGDCAIQYDAPDTPCDDDPCFEGQACDEAHACSGGAPVICDDGDDCTDDWCDGGCQAAPSQADTPCEDGDLCTLDDLCDGGGGCVSGALKDCDDGQACSVDACEPSTGDCVYAVNDHDANDCCLVDADCDDGNACTIEACSDQLRCAYQPLDCGHDVTGCAFNVCGAGGACGEIDLSARRVLFDHDFAAMNTLRGIRLGRWAGQDTALVEGGALRVADGTYDAHVELPPMWLPRGLTTLRLRVTDETSSSAVEVSGAQDYGEGEVSAIVDEPGYDLVFELESFYDRLEELQLHLYGASVRVQRLQITHHGAAGCFSGQGQQDDPVQAGDVRAASACVDGQGRMLVAWVSDSQVSARVIEPSGESSDEHEIGAVMYPGDAHDTRVQCVVLDDGWLLLFGADYDPSHGAGTDTRWWRLDAQGNQVAGDLPLTAVPEGRPRLVDMTRVPASGKVLVTTVERGEDGGYPTNFLRVHAFQSDGAPQTAGAGSPDPWSLELTTAGDERIEGTMTARGDRAYLLRFKRHASTSDLKAFVLTDGPAQAGASGSSTAINGVEARTYTSSVLEDDDGALRVLVVAAREDATGDVSTLNAWRFLVSGDEVSMVDHGVLGSALTCADASCEQPTLSQPLRGGPWLSFRRRTELSDAVLSMPVPLNGVIDNRDGLRTVSLDGGAPLGLRYSWPSALEIAVARDEQISLVRTGLDCACGEACGWLWAGCTPDGGQEVCVDGMGMLDVTPGCLGGGCVSPIVCE